MTQLTLFNYNEYRNKPGIYRFLNIETNKSYVGQSINLGRRIYAHLREMRKGNTEQVIYKAVNKYGLENIYVEILTVLPECENLKKYLDLCEKVYIDYFDSYKNGYNSTLGGDGGILGYKMSDEEKLKRSLAQKGRLKDPLVVGPKAKTVYMYNYESGLYITASSTLDAARLLNATGKEGNPGPIQDCARKPSLHTTRGFICSYSLEELKEKINLYEYKIKEINRKRNCTSS